jgi:predicted alpha/beta-hydrolase family hydrolase
VKGKVSWCWLDTADHGFKPLRSSGRTLDDVLAAVADASVAWVAGLT